MPIEHVSDTARWVAVYRAMESERPDAHFRDPHARRLAGARGEEIVATMKRGRAVAWAMIVRTIAFDEIIMETIGRDGVDLVLNLAAGLDARPWRLALPSSLRWVDIDLPAIVEYKRGVIGDAGPVCAYSSVPADLTDAAARRALFARFAAESRRVLVVTEGLLIYLTPQQVGELATDLHAQPTFHSWLIDIASPRLMKMMARNWGKTLAKGNAPFQFAPAEGTAFFKPFGWREMEFRSSMDEARRLKRQMEPAWLWQAIGWLYPNRIREEWRRMAGIVLLGRELWNG
jgi:methyltransferase (TIGR00027 family)